MMNRAIVAGAARLLLVTAWVAAVFAAVVLAPGPARPDTPGLVLPFVAAAICVLGLLPLQHRLDALVGRFARHPATTRYAALAEAAARVGAGSLEQALPGLARVLAEGTGARRARLWLTVEDELVAAASHPPAAPAEPDTVANLALLLARPDSHHVVPVLDGPRLIAALVIDKPDRAVTPADRLLMRDVANGAGVLLRGVALNAELQGRMRRAHELADELRASRRRLTQAREVERRRLVTELDSATTARLAGLRAELETAADALDEIVLADPGEDTRAADDAARAALGRARLGLDELLERFRVIARGVYPAVLRDQGPFAALDELATDMPRPILLAGAPARRLAWEIESGLYYIAASVMRRLAGRAGGRPLRMHLSHGDGQLGVRVDDPTPVAAAAELRAELDRDIDRLTALGGEVAIEEDPTGTLVVHAWLPDHLAPSAELINVPAAATTRSGW